MSGLVNAVTPVLPALLASLLSLAIQHSPATLTYHVPGDFDTIQEAVDASMNADSIVIHAGTYEEAVVVSGKINLEIMAKGKVVIDPPGDTPGMAFDTCTNVTVTKVRVTGATDGFALSNCTNCDLIKCRVDDVTGHGIGVDGCTQVTIDHCTIKATGGDGIALGATRGVPSNNCGLAFNKVFDAGDEGIDISGNDNSIAGCLVVECAGDGFRTESVPAATSNSFTLDKAVKTGNHGYRIQGDDNTLQASKTIKAEGNGYQLSDGSGHIVLECKAIKPASDGLFGVDTALAVSVIDCKFKKPGTNGIDIDGDDALVDGCKTTGSLGNGYFVLGDDGTWIGNKATGSANHGFHLVGSGNTLTFNKAKGSQQGFDLLDEGKGNSIDDSNDFGTQSP